MVVPLEGSDMFVVAVDGEDCARKRIEINSQHRLAISKGKNSSTTLISQSKIIYKILNLFRYFKIYF
jgi:hypothetical protein